MKDYRFLLIIGFFVTLLAKGWTHLYSFDMVSFLLVLTGTVFTITGLVFWVGKKKTPA